jgi:mannose-1-phosphate guanylyltransferase
VEAIYAVVIAGGSGTRFWPASRKALPKQLLPLGKSAEEPLLAATVRRIEPLCPAERTYVATGAHLVDATRETLPELPSANVLAEPVARNTAPCIGWAAHVVARRDPDGVVMVFPADHAVTDEDAFRSTLREAVERAREGRIVTIGLEPTRPETGYGYIEVGDALGGSAFQVARFVEKPDRARAQTFIEGKRHVWNGGMFIFRASVMKAAIREHLPALGEGLDRIDQAAREGREKEALASEFPRLPDISIDHGIMEKAKGLAVVRASFGWSDVGSWESAWELSSKDAAENAAPEGTILIDASRNLVRDLRRDGKKRVIALVGVDDLVVIETDDAVLVLPRARAQDVRQVVDELKKRGSDSL